MSDGTVESVVAALRSAHPELERVAAATGDPVYLVGGAVRDQLLGRERADIDVVVVGDASALARELGVPLVEHDRFGTVKVEFDGHVVDIAAARTEAYPGPGALPVVAPATDIEADLARRDFTINAMALPLGGEPRLIDPCGGREDLERGLLRVLHDRSFLDDPTRAIRAARYAARFGFGLEPDTERLLREADLGTVSADRRRAELERLAAEPTALGGFRRLAEWGLVELRRGGLELAAATEEALQKHDWPDSVTRERALVRAALGPVGEEERLALVSPAAAEGVALAERSDPIELVLARALGAMWVHRYMSTWRHVELEIDGSDLIAAGISEGPAVGRGLAAALRGRLEEEIYGREQELAAALEAARED